MADPIPGKPDRAPLDTYGMPPPSSELPRAPMPDRSGEQPWIGKAKKKARRKR